jgi:hypothetical protein
MNIHFSNGSTTRILASEIDSITFNDPEVFLIGDTLYVSTIDNSTGIQWYNGTYTTTGATSTTDGEANTLKIISNQGIGSYAAQVCSDLNYFGFDDWYLPARDEIIAMFLNKDAIGGFELKYYWSSSEVVGYNGYAVSQYFSGGFISYDDKADKHKVRCVRR